MENLFVYGTLLFAGVVKKVTGKTFQTTPATLHGYRRCRLVGCDYPAISEDENTKTEGALLFDVDEDSMKKIELFEGDEYEKKKVNVFSNSETYEAIVFVWKSNSNFLTQNEWRSSEFEKNNLKNYL